MTIGEKAFLDTLAFAEGTLGVGNNGYDVLLKTDRNNSRVIKNWAKDTTIQHQLNDWRIQSLDSNAAGRYQFIGSTWISINNNVNAPMTKDNQDIAALKLLRTKLGSNFTFELTSEDDMKQVAANIKKIWASFDSNAIGGHSVKELYGWYVRAHSKYKLG